MGTERSVFKMLLEIALTTVALKSNEHYQPDPLGAAAMLFDADHPRIERCSGNGDRSPLPSQNSICPNSLVAPRTWR